MQWLGVGRNWNGRVFVTQFGFLFCQIHICVGYIGLSALSEPIGDRHKLRIKIVQPLAMFSRQADRVTKPKAIRFDHTGIGGFAFGFVGCQNDMSRFFAQDISKHQIRRGHADPGIDHEQADICHIHSAFGQTAHAALKAVIRHFFKPSGVNHRETQVCQACCAFAQVACYTRLIINQCQLFADKAVE